MMSSSYAGNPRFGFCSGKAPVNAGLGVIAAGLPGFDLAFEDFGVGDAAIEALSA
jgi:hypothetical protein